MDQNGDHAQSAIQSIDRLRFCSRAAALHYERERADEQLHGGEQCAGEGGVQRGGESAGDAVGDTENGIQFAFNRATASSKWSNLPCGAACRNGLQFSTLSATQLDAALAVAQAALSSAGYGTFDGIRKADDFLGSLGASSTYNSGIYFIAFIGTPSSTGEWILQLGGHH